MRSADVSLFLFCHSHNSLYCEVRPALRILSMKPVPPKLNEIPANLSCKIQPFLRLYSAVSLFPPLPALSHLPKKNVTRAVLV